MTATAATTARTATTAPAVTGTKSGKYEVQNYAGSKTLVVYTGKGAAMKYVLRSEFPAGYRVVSPTGKVVASDEGVQARYQHETLTRQDATEAAAAAVATRAYDLDPDLRAAATEAVAEVLTGQDTPAPKKAAKKAPKKAAKGEPTSIRTAVSDVAAEVLDAIVGGQMKGRVVGASVNGVRYALTPVSLYFRKGTSRLWTGTWTAQVGDRTLTVVMTDGRWRAADGTAVPTMSQALASHLG